MGTADSNVGNQRRPVELATTIERSSTPPAPAAPVQADSLYRAAERIDSQNIGREQYNAPRPVMNPVRAPIDNDLLSDLDIGTPQQPSKSGIDTSSLMTCCDTVMLKA